MDEKTNSRKIESNKESNISSSKLNDLVDKITRIEEWLRDEIFSSVQNDPGFSSKKVKLQHLNVPQTQNRILSEIDKHIAKNPGVEKNAMLELRTALNFTTIYDLRQIMNSSDKKWKNEFSGKFGKYRSFEKKLDQIEEFRNMIYHRKKTVSGQDGLDYDPDVISECETGINWFNKIYSKISS